MDVVIAVGSYELWSWVARIAFLAVALLIVAVAVSWGRWGPLAGGVVVRDKREQDGRGNRTTKESNGKN